MDKQKSALILSQSVTYSSEDSDSSTLISDISSLTDIDSYYEEDTLILPITLYLLRGKNKRRDYYKQIIESWTDSEFKNRLKLSKHMSERLIDDLEKSGCIPCNKFGLKPLEPKVCFYIFLTFITSSEPLVQIASKFNVSISSTFRVIRRVIAWLLTKLNDAIRWPTEEPDIKNISTLFFNKTGVSKVIGIIDCLHIKIKKPKSTRQYNNSKGYSSIVLQATVDANLMFTNIYCGEPGSSNCIEVLKKSPLYNTFIENKSVLFPQNTHLLGHSGYPKLAWLVPPYRDNKQLSFEQKKINFSHKTARKISEKAFFILKSRFKRIKVLSIYRNVDFVTDTVVAACILHNYCVNDKSDSK